MSRTSSLFPSRGRKVHVTASCCRSAIKVCATSKVEATPRDVNIGLCRRISNLQFAHTRSQVPIVAHTISRNSHIQGRWNQVPRLRLLREATATLPTQGKSSLNNHSIHCSLKFGRHVTRQQHPVLRATSQRDSRSHQQLLWHTSARFSAAQSFVEH
jgi:hypothetical protein